MLAVRGGRSSTVGWDGGWRRQRESRRKGSKNRGADRGARPQVLNPIRLFPLKKERIHIYSEIAMGCCCFLPTILHRLLSGSFPFSLLYDCVKVGLSKVAKSYVDKFLSIINCIIVILITFIIYYHYHTYSLLLCFSLFLSLLLLLFLFFFFVLLFLIIIIIVINSTIPIYIVINNSITE
uniref:Uncharacterized protein n=1 Tax=Opuntia streptacantha TaxID=393608 RepID=A0A7C8Z9G1_OPUST